MLVPVASTFAISLALAAHALPFHDSHAAIMSTTLRRTANTKANRTTAWASHQAAKVRGKYHHAAPPLGRRASALGSTPLVNVNADTIYFGTVVVGKPPAPFNLILDTGSADLWIAGSSCTTCSNVPQFNPTLSSTFNSSNTGFSIQYGSGAAEGVMGADVVQMAGFEVPNQSFAVATDVSDGLLTNAISGILGLGFGTIAASGTTPFVQTLAQEGVLQSPLFSFFLTRFADVLETGDSATQFGGEFMIGATNTSLYTGDIEFVDIPAGREGFWGLEMSTMLVNGVDVPIPAISSFSAIDTGTTLIAGPASLVADLYAQVPGSIAGSGDLQDFWVYPCASNFTLELGFGTRGQNTLWRIDSSDLELMRLSRTLCVGSIFALDIGHSQDTSAPAWIIGDTFLKNVYSVYQFQPPAVGFAPLSPLAESLSGKRDVPLADPTAAAAPVRATASTGTDSDSTLSMGKTPAGGASGTAASMFSMVALAVVVGGFLL